MGQHLIANPECAKTYADENFRIIWQARSSFHLSVLESVYIKTQTQSCVDKKSLFFHLDSSSKSLLIGSNWSNLGPVRCILSH